MEHDDERRQGLIEDLLAERSPAILGDMSEEEVELAQTVAFLKAARPEALQPDPEFVERLRARLFEPATHSRDGAPGKGVPGAHEGQAGSALTPPAPQPRARALTRRRLLTALAGGTATGLALGGVAGRVAAEGDTSARVHAAEQRAAEAERKARDLEQDEYTPYSVPLVGSLGRWVPIASDEDLAPGEARQFTQGALIFYLLRDSEGGYSAFSAVCTHMGCLLNWQASGRRLLCPCHGSAYDATGQVVSGVARHPLPRIQVRVHGGNVEVWTISADATQSGVPPYTAP
jgi:nitrite reductase/ring-hydroxylating ferredoxin subunit